MSDIVADVTLKDNSIEVKRIFASAVRRGLDAIGMSAEGHAKASIQKEDRIDTGRLLNSITHKVKDDTVYVGTNVEYALWHEVGTGVYASDGQGRKEPWGYTDEYGEFHITSGVKPIHYLRDASTKHSDEYKALMKDSLENA